MAFLWHCKEILGYLTHPLHWDHPPVQLCPVQVADALGGLVRGAHRDKAVAASAWAFGIGYHFSADNLGRRK